MSEQDGKLAAALSESLGVEPSTFEPTSDKGDADESVNATDETITEEKEPTSENETVKEESDDTQTEKVSLGDDDVLKYFEGKIKYNKETPALKDLGIESMDDFVAYTQMGLNYNKQKEKAKSLEQKLESYNGLVKELYPDIDTTDKLLEAMVANEMKYIEEEYRKKYDDEKDVEKLLKGDDRYNKLKYLEPIKVNKEEIEQNYSEQVNALNEKYGEEFKDFKELPYEIREIAVEHDLELADAYKLINFDEIVNKRVEKAKKSLMADINENKAKSIPKGNGQKESKPSETEADKRLKNQFETFFGTKF